MLRKSLKWPTDFKDTTDLKGFFLKETLMEKIMCKSVVSVQSVAHCVTSVITLNPNAAVSKIQLNPNKIPQILIQLINSKKDK